MDDTTPGAPERGSRARVPCPWCADGEMSAWAPVETSGGAVRLGATVLLGRTCSVCSRVDLSARSHVKHLPRDTRSSPGADVLHGLGKNVVAALAEVLRAAGVRRRR